MAMLKRFIAEYWTIQLCEGCAKKKLCDPAGLCKVCGDDAEWNYDGEGAK